MPCRHGRWLLLLTSTVLLAAGCRNCCRRPAPAPCPPNSTFNPGGPLPGPSSPPGFVPTAPPSAAPAFGQPPPQTTPFAPVPPSSSQVPPAPTQVSPEVRYGPSASLPSQVEWRAPTRPEVRLALPETSTTEPPRDSASPPMPPAPGSPGVSEERSPTPPLPVGIPQFAQVKDKVASGLRPLLDGLDWLQSNGYRTVLRVGLPGEDDSADRRLVERRGLKYVNLEVSPQSLARTTAEDFNRLVGDTAAQPLFVYDRDGMLAGSLWYLQFRMVDGLPDDAARAKAARLGLKEDPSGEHRLMWLAIQKVLSDLNR